MGSDSRDALSWQLSNLLGFEDGASDVLDYLLSIEDSEVLLEYLGQLLGSTTDEKVLNFVENVGKVQRGESISIAEEEKATAQQQTQPNEPIGNKASSAISSQKSNESSVSAATTTKVSGEGGEESRNKKLPAAKATAAPQQPAQKKQVKEVSSSQSQTRTPITSQSIGSKPDDNKNEVTTAEASSAQKPKASTEYEKGVAAAKAASGEPTTTSKSNQPSSSKKTTTKKNKKKDRPPITGKAPFECGCFGIKHKPLANCLYCGRVSCEKEGYNFCPFCGHLVKEVTPPDENEYDEKEIGPALKAWKLKESMLQKDRSQSRRRAQVIDDQSDYFPSAGEATSAWLNENERAAARTHEEERQNELHRRQNMQLKLASS